MFTRDDWVQFRTLDGCALRAGVSVDELPRVLLKELVDNSLDEQGSCKFGRLSGGGFFVEDAGAGFSGSPKEVAALFSIGRPLTSTKLLRLPTRGARGNGLRGIAGCVLASGGKLVVKTGGRSLRLVPQDDGTTLVRDIGSYKRAGTRVEVVLGASLVGRCKDPLLWAGQADHLAVQGGRTYKGKSSPFWYDADSFFELCAATDPAWSVRDLVSELEGCSGRAAGELAAPFRGRAARSLTRREAEVLLKMLRARARPVKASRLGFLGRGLGSGYARETGTYPGKAARGSFDASIPFVIEAWADLADDPAVVVHVNRTPITAELCVSRQNKDKGAYVVFGCGLCHVVHLGRSDFSFTVNIQTPYIPITSEGKAPDLGCLCAELVGVMEKAARGASRAARGDTHAGGRPLTQKGFLYRVLRDCTDTVSEGGRLPFNQRHLWYEARPRIIEAFGKEPNYDTFCQIITQYERDILHKDIPGMVRDARGVFYVPHSNNVIAVGTAMVEKFERPPWRIVTVHHWDAPVVAAYRPPHNRSRSVEISGQEHRQPV